MKRLISRIEGASTGRECEVCAWGNNIFSSGVRTGSVVGRNFGGYQSLGMALGVNLRVTAAFASGALLDSQQTGDLPVFSGGRGHVIFSLGAFSTPKRIGSQFAWGFPMTTRSYQRVGDTPTCPVPLRGRAATFARKLELRKSRVKEFRGR